MRDRVAVVTGASSGLGRAAALALAAQGWRVIGTGRDPGRIAAAGAALRAAATGGAIDMVQADLATLAGAAAAARAIAALTDRIDVLINNAGGMADRRILTEDGYERTMAANHVGPFLLTERLLPLLRRAAADAPAGSVRILNTASDASEMTPGLDLDDVGGAGNAVMGLAYCRAKLANVLHARGLARRLAADGIVAHAMHPGYVESNFITYAEPASQARMRARKGRSAEDGADTLVWLATSPEGGAGSGGYWHDRAPRPPHPAAADDAIVDRLWAESEKLVARAPA